MRPDFIPVGAVVNAHGIRGEVKVNPAGFDPEFIASFKTLYIGCLLYTSPSPRDS